MKPIFWHVLDASFVATIRDPSQIVQFPQLHFAVAGRSNVGKSSLLNALFQRRNLVRTSSTPGCTRALQIFQVRVRSAEPVTMQFVDLPGYGFAQRSLAERRQWSALIDTFFAQGPSLKALLLLFDGRRGLEEEESMLIELCAYQRLTVVYVATKVDKVPRSQRTRLKLPTVASKVFPVSSKTGEGLPELSGKLLELMPEPGSRPIV